jgi:hypothetical protein
MLQLSSSAHKATLQNTQPPLDRFALVLDIAPVFNSLCAAAYINTIYSFQALDAYSSSVLSGI